MGLRDINWGLAWGVLVVAVVTFGTGVSLGRHYPAQPRGESRLLEHRLLEICAGGKVSSLSVFTILYKARSFD
jgi:hypothetical protein